MVYGGILLKEKSMLNKLKIDRNQDLWHQPFWDPLLAGIVFAGWGILLVAGIGGILSK
jgi:hypothetical protein